MCQKSVSTYIMSTLRAFRHGYSANCTFSHCQVELHWVFFVWSIPWAWRIVPPSSAVPIYRWSSTMAFFHHLRITFFWWFVLFKKTAMIRSTKQGDTIILKQNSIESLLFCPPKSNLYFYTFLLHWRSNCCRSYCWPLAFHIPWELSISSIF